MATTASELNRQIEIWHRYGAYLSGIKSIAAQRPGLTLDILYAAIERSGSWGGWSRVAIANAFNAGKEVSRARAEEFLSGTV